MATKLRSMFIAVVISLGAMMVTTIPVGYSQELPINWHNGQRPQQVYLINPRPTVAVNSSHLANNQAIAPLRAPMVGKKMTTALDPDGPWFSDLPGGGGRVRSLPGGLLVKFKHTPTPIELEQWTLAQQVEILRPVGSPQTFLIQSPPGAATLTLATRLAADPLVSRVTPNWKSRIQLR